MGREGEADWTAGASSGSFSVLGTGATRIVATATGVTHIRVGCQSVELSTRLEAFAVTTMAVAVDLPMRLRRRAWRHLTSVAA